MSAAATEQRRRRAAAPPRPDDRRTLAWLSVIGVTVSILTSDMLWTPLSAFLDAARDAPAGERAAPFVPDRQMAQIIEMTQDAAATPAYAPEKAISINQAIPFARAPVAVARPFAVPADAPATRLTALKCLTQAVYYEAAMEPVSGRRAVAQVVLNRMAHPAFPKSVCGVVYQGVNRPVCQFSFTCDGSLNRRPNPARWQEAEQVAAAALAGYVEPSVGHSTHYHANYVSPYWAPKLFKIAQIGAHIFYRWPGRWGMPAFFSGRYSGVEAIPAIVPRRALLSHGPVDSPVAGPRTERDRLIALQDRRADNDHGGRLDTAAGWELAIPQPEETSRAARMMARQQDGDFDIAARGDGA